MIRNKGRSKGKAAPKISTYPVREEGELLPFLLERRKEGRNTVKGMLARGQIAVNGRAVTAHNHVLVPGDSVAVSLEKVAEPERLTGLRILYEDADLIVVHKDAGLLSIASEREKEWTAYRQLTDHVRAEGPDQRLFIVHRLDRDTSGVMLFAKREDIKRKLQGEWTELVKERKYAALVEGMVRTPEGRVESWLKETKTLKMYSSPYPNDGQHAVTHYRLLRANRQFSLLEVELETGRKNQIRVHMQDIGHPIVGDKKYGARSNAIGRLGLHARVLAFEHPGSGKPMRFESEIPARFFRVFDEDGG